MFVIEKSKVIGLRKKSKRFKRKAIKVLICIALILGLLAAWPSHNLALLKAEAVTLLGSESEEQYLEMYGIRTLDENSLIRFHVIANSDSEEDQKLKYAVRDEILKKAAPILAQSRSLDESRQILHDMEPELIAAAQKVVKDWGKKYEISYDYGRHTFPAKSYGTIVLPAGDYESVKIKIGEAQGANWWCVLFPPLCFVDVEESTSVPVDGSSAVPLDSVQKDSVTAADKSLSSDSEKELDEAESQIKQKKSKQNNSQQNKKVRFFIVEKLFG